MTAASFELWRMDDMSMVFDGFLLFFWIYLFDLDMFLYIVMA